MSEESGTFSGVDGASSGAPTTDGVTTPPPAIAVEPDQAWRALGQINDWIKHADAKSGATLAAAGAAAVMLYNLVKDQHQPGLGLSAVAFVCGASVVGAGACASMALVPRLSIESWWLRRRAQCAARRSDEVVPTAPEDDPVGLLFFVDIAKRYDGEGSSYIEALSALTADPAALTRQVAHQVHANATVAHRKFAWVERSIRFLITGVAALAVVAMIIGAKG